jgi:DNA-binding transcriptional regulator PaaX
MKQNGRLVMQQVLCYGFSSFSVRADAKLRAEWAGVPIGSCRTALRRLIARGYVVRVKNQPHRLYGLTESGVAARQTWWVERYSK